MIEIIPNWHPLFVHFTVALFTLSVIFFVIQRPLAETEIGDNFMLFARYSLWLGVLFSVATLVAGVDAYNTVNHDTPSHTAMTDHRNWGLATFAIFLIAAIWWKMVDRISERASIAFLLCLFVGAGLLVTTGHKGSQLVYHYGLGVESLPAKDDHKAGGGHDHAHGDAAGSDHHANDVEAGGAAHSHDDAMQGDDGHAHDHGSADSSHESLDSMDMDKTGEKTPVPANDMKMDSQMMEPDISSSNKAESAPKVASEPKVESAPKVASKPKIAVASKSKVVVVVSEPEVATDFESNKNNTFLIPNDENNTFLIPKIEKYEDGTTRETLPEVALDIQE